MWDNDRRSNLNLYSLNFLSVFFVLKLNENKDNELIVALIFIIAVFVLSALWIRKKIKDAE